MENRQFSPCGRLGEESLQDVELGICRIRFGQLGGGRCGGLAEWSIAPVLKTDGRESVPRVRIPEPPPLAFIETRMCPDAGVIFFMFQRGLGLATELARMPEHR